MEKLSSRTPSLRFPEFNNLWEHKKMSELLTESKRLNGDLKFSKEEVLSVSGEFGIVNQIEHLGRSYAGESVHNYHVVETGDIVYTKSPLKANPYGIIKLNKGNAGIVSTLYAVYNVQESNAKGLFLDYYFSLDANTNRYLRPLVKKGSKNDMKINNTYVLHDRIFIPTLPEQQKIASFLTSVDTRLTQLKQKKNLLEQYKKGVMQKLFSREIRFRDDEGKAFPEWEEKRLGEIGENIIGLTYSPKNVVDNGIIVLRSSNIKNDVLDLVDQVKVNAKISDKLTIKKGDILICTRNGSQRLIGKNIIIDDVSIPMTFGAFMSVFRSEMNPFLVHLFKTDMYLMQIQQNLGARINQITTGQLNKFAFHFPCMEEQTKIANFLTSLDEKINHCSSQIEKTEQWKKGLLQQMFC